MPALRVHLEALGVPLTPELVEQLLRKLPDDVWRGAALIVGCRPPSADTIQAVIAECVADYTIDNRPTELDLDELEHLWPPAGERWH